MAILIKHETTGVQYVLIGTGYSYYKDSLPGAFGGVLFPNVDEGELQMVALCDASGDIRWLPTSEVTVLSVDGVAVSELLKGKNDDYERSEKCPACNYPITAKMSVCPSCELRLISDDEDSRY